MYICMYLFATQSSAYMCLLPFIVYNLYYPLFLIWYRRRRTVVCIEPCCTVLGTFLEVDCFLVFSACCSLFFFYVRGRKFASFLQLYFYLRTLLRAVVVVSLIIFLLCFVAPLVIDFHVDWISNLVCFTKRIHCFFTPM